MAFTSGEDGYWIIWFMHGITQIQYTQYTASGISGKTGNW